ncbi:carbamoyltransferase C-terminal domain-containing protein [Phreatobacter aquaticus]|uniref:carbamoyltransferase C-terminal domain-containing protein n=1 Tax=Phreatobacter aquaticus TaxID=2570229 RepID=UPI00143D32BC|nr:carbamoyltransferase C-terminal domain-containing protein [Phreatobacter aquaticus]
MIILGFYQSHDACAALYDDYRCLASVALERVTRIKTDGYRFPSEAVAECLASAGLTPGDIGAVCYPRMRYPADDIQNGFHRFGGLFGAHKVDPIAHLRSGRAKDLAEVVDVSAFAARHGWPAGAETFFYNHHKAHALATLAHMPADEVLLYTADGGGDDVFYSARLLKDGQLTDLFGGEADTLARTVPQRPGDSLGKLYAYVTEALGFRSLRHEGKVLGLAAFGKPVHAERMTALYQVSDDGQIHCAMPRWRVRMLVNSLAKKCSREDMAASVQQTLENVILAALAKLLRRAPVRHLGLSGGVFANVKLTQRIAERFDLDEIFVYPAMSDQGEADGGVLEFLLKRDGLASWLGHREKLGNVYRGRDYTGDVDRVFAAGGAVKRPAADPIDEAATIIAAGGIVGTYLGRMEYGPRALGARSIIAAATDRSINDWLNKRLDRTDFMPFAPVVRAEKAKDLFLLPDELAYTANFMTVTCDVKPEWREKIPACVHVDGTARPQLIHREQNPVYYDVLAAYEQKTGIPALINTSFNVHEEPIINKPEEALRALKEGRVDHLLSENAVWSLG